MLVAIVLDVLLIVILLTMIPLGFLRGGLREVCSSAGLLLGMLLALNWSDRWGSAISDGIALSEGTGHFLVAIALVVLCTAVLGYGGSAAFAYRPGPGGRMYGAFLAMLNGIVFTGFLINAVINDVYEGQLPNAVQEGYVSRALSVGFEWVLLVGALSVLAATVFGMFVRERSDDEFAYSPPAGQVTPEQPQSTRRTSAIPLAAPPAGDAEGETGGRAPSPVRIREVRHWEDPSPQRQGQPEYGGGWRQTWPEPKGKGTALPWEQQPPSPERSSRPNPPPPGKGAQKPPSRRDVLRDWMKEESSRGES
jgi:uncharacterized membrane protein required for colicin V production